MRFDLRVLPLVALVMGVSGVVVAQGHGAYEPVNGSLMESPAAAYAQDYDHHDDWDQPPHEFREIQRQGFHDGVEGAKKDFDHHRMPDVDNRAEYRHPNVPKSDREDYREGYRRGYEAAMAHLTGEPGPR
jgi:hypothetical protein